MTNRVAASLSYPDTDSCLAALDKVSLLVSLAEVRLDLMESFDLSRLISKAARPLIVTCRAGREGGRFAGSEDERLKILAQAMDLGCEYVDVEWDCVSEFRRRRGVGTKIIVSRHWQDHMPSDLGPDYERLRGEADAVKLVGFARRLSDIFPVFDLMRKAGGPVIGLAMGEPGRLTRLLAPWFPNCLLTYGAIDLDGVTAPGQFTVSEMVQQYHLDAVGPQTSVHVHLCANPESANSVIAENSRAKPETALYLPVLVSPEDGDDFLRGIRESLPEVHISADAQLSLPVPERCFG